jgi:ubiquitin-like domain-containing CTD phosphatase 1
VKLTELGMLTHPGYKFCFVLDKTSMFTVASTKRDGTKVVHHVKPLQIIWSKFPRWGSHNTAHVDDLSRNFALNLGSGVKVSGFYRKKSSARRDSELLGLTKYFEDLAAANVNFDEANFGEWLDVVNGKRPLLKKDTED